MLNLSGNLKIKIGTGLIAQIYNSQKLNHSRFWGLFEGGLEELEGGSVESALVIEKARYGRLCTREAKMTALAKWHHMPKVTLWRPNRQINGRQKSSFSRFSSKISSVWDSPGGPVAKILGSQYRGSSFNPWSANLIPHATAKTWCSQINK